MKRVLKHIYSKWPYKRELFSQLKKVLPLPHGIYKHLHFNGIFTVQIDSAHAFKMMHYGFQLENEIFWKGIQSGWERESMKLWILLCNLGSQTIVDVGANTGVFSLVAKAIDYNHKVIALEPVPRVFEKLMYNNKLNGFDINCIKVAASNYTGDATIFDTGGEHIYSVTVNRNLSDSPNMKEVPVTAITLDELMFKYRIAKVDLIKIDVETHEPEVLEGFKWTLSNFKPAILIEVLNDVVASKVEALVRNYQYLYYNIDERLGARRTNSIMASDSYNYLLCSEDTAKRIGLEK